MNSLGLKLYYQRTRVKKATQMIMAKELGIRQATISNLEQDISQPSLPLLRVLCEYFDITPTYLLDPELPLDAGPGELWSNRQTLIGTGQYLEVTEKAIHGLKDGQQLVAILPGTVVYDEEAARMRANGHDDLAAKNKHEINARRRREEDLRKELENERHASRMRRRGISRSKTESMNSSESTG